MARIITAFALILTICLVRAGEPGSSKPVTTYFEIEQLHAPCCAVMLKYSLTNITGVASADIFVTNRVVRVVHQPGKVVHREIRQAFRDGAIGAKRLKKAPQGPLR